MTDRGSPIEYTGEAHLVGVSCDGCGSSVTVAEETARSDVAVACGDCIEINGEVWVVDDDEKFDNLTIRKCDQYSSFTKFAVFSDGKKIKTRTERGYSDLLYWANGFDMGFEEGREETG